MLASVYTATSAMHHPAMLPQNLLYFLRNTCRHVCQENKEFTREIRNYPTPGNIYYPFLMSDHLYTFPVLQPLPSTPPQYPSPQSYLLSSSSVLPFILLLSPTFYPPPFILLLSLTYQHVLYFIILPQFFFNLLPPAIPCILPTPDPSHSLPSFALNLCSKQ